MPELKKSAGGVIIAPNLPSVEKFINRAKEAEWQVEDLPFNHPTIPPVPEPSPNDRHKEEREGIWRSVIGQQLQADLGAIAMGTQLLNAAPDLDAKNYYSTLVRDEIRHTIAWEMLTGMTGPASERDPFLAELIRMDLEADYLEQKVFLMQVFFERTIIRDFNDIIQASNAAQAKRGAQTTVVAELCKKLTIDDGIHHGSGVAYERVLLERAPRKMKQRIAHIAEQAFPIYANHKLWRPPERRRIGHFTVKGDMKRISEEANRGIRDAAKLGIDLGHVSVNEVIDKAVAKAA